MTAIEQYEPTSNLPAQSTGAAIPVNLRVWAEEARAAHALATSLSATSFVPEAFRGKPGEATAAILAGAEVGLSPIAALNAYDVIQGRPAPKAITLRAIAQSHGHSIWPVEMTPTKCVMRGRRRGETETVEVKWDMDRARALKLAGKPNWQQQPQAMLVARCTSEITRLVAADVLLGIPYSAEELQDEEPATVTVKRGTTRMRRADAAPIPEPEIDEAPSAEPSDEELAEMEAEMTADPQPEPDGLFGGE